MLWLWTGWLTTSLHPKKRKIIKVQIENDHSMSDEAEDEEEDDEHAEKEDDLSDLDSFGEVREKVDLSRKRKGD